MTVSTDPAAARWSLFRQSVAARLAAAAGAAAVLWLVVFWALGPG